MGHDYAGGYMSVVNASVYHKIEEVYTINILSLPADV